MTAAQALSERPQPAGAACCLACGRPMVDELTGVLDRSSWTAQAQRRLDAVRRARQPAALAIADLDRFKRINDTYGHLAGDAVLRAVGVALTVGVGETGLVGRYGRCADEFLIFLPGLDGVGATRLLQPVSAQLRELSVPVLTDRRTAAAVTNQTASIGVAELLPVDGGETTLADLILDADAALRRSKRGGRNRILVSSAGPAGRRAAKPAASARLGPPSVPRYAPTSTAPVRLAPAPVVPRQRTRAVRRAEPPPRALPRAEAPAPPHRGGLVGYRLLAGYTRAELAASIGVSATTIRRWETTPSVPMPARRRDLAHALGLSPAQLDAALRA